MKPLWDCIHLQRAPSNLCRGAVEDNGDVGRYTFCAFNDENMACDLVG